VTPKQLHKIQNVDPSEIRGRYSAVGHDGHLLENIENQITSVESDATMKQCKGTRVRNASGY
jgi:ribulose 1,5-bisphosphate synthetase/thiazole synthase